MKDPKTRHDPYAVTWRCMSRNQRVKAEADTSGHRESRGYWENDLHGQGLSRRTVVMRVTNKGSPKGR